MQSSMYETRENQARGPQPRLLVSKTTRETFLDRRLLPASSMCMRLSSRVFVKQFHCDSTCTSMFTLEVCDGLRTYEANDAARPRGSSCIVLR